MNTTASDKQSSPSDIQYPAGHYLIFVFQQDNENTLENSLDQILSANNTVTLVFVTDEECQATTNIMAAQHVYWNFDSKNVQPTQALFDKIQAQLLATQANIIWIPSAWQENSAAQFSATVVEALNQLDINAELWFYGLDEKVPCNAHYQTALFYCLSSHQFTNAQSHFAIPNPSKAFAQATQLLQKQNYPLISVIVRTQNRPNLLLRALQSLVAQSYPRVEAVVVNDGGCHIDKLIQRFKDLFSGGLRYIEHDKVQGRSRAANTGIAAATGEWLAFLDDDDTFEIEGLSRLARFIAWDKSVIYGQVHLLKMQGESKQSQRIGLFAESYNPDVLLLNNYVPICAYICKHERAKEIGGFDEDFEFLEDWDFFYRLTRGQGVQYVAEPVSNYCVWGESYTTGKNVTQEIINRERFFAKHLPTLTPAELQRASLAFVQLRDTKQDELNQYYQENLKQTEAHKKQIEQALQQQTQAMQATQEQNQQLAQENQRLHTEQYAEQLLCQERLQVAHQKNQEILMQCNEKIQIKEQEITQKTQAIELQLTQKIEAKERELQLIEQEFTQQIQTKEQELQQKNQAIDKLLEELAQLNQTVNALTNTHAACMTEKQHFINEVQHCQQNADNLNQSIQHLEQYQKQSTQRWVQRTNELLTHLTLPLAFEHSCSLLDLNAFGWTPILQAFIGHNSHVHEFVPAYADIAFPLPIVQHKTLRWLLEWPHPLQVDALLLKMATYLRTNQCTLELQLTPLDIENAEVINARLQGQYAKDHSFAAFNLSRPLTAGRYWCELHSPDTDNADHLLGIWLTSNHKRRSGYISPHYHYVEPDAAALLRTLATLNYKPLISVVIPTYNTPALYLRACLESVVQQIYPHWELCIADDASTQTQVKIILEAYKARFPDKIKVHYGEVNQHISASSNAALDLVEGEFVALLDHDDLLSKNALIEVVRCLNESKHPNNIDVIYTDEDKWDEDRQVFDEPHFKPDWSPENLRGQMYIGHLGVYRTSRMREVKGFRLTVVGSQDWDLALRITELGGEVKHIPTVLYHWRKHGGSTAGNIGQKNYAVEAGLRVVRDALEREQQGGKAEFAFGSSHILVHYPVPEKEQQRVSIIIPNKDQAALFKVCVDSVIANNTYKNWEIVVVDNGSKSTAIKKLYKRYEDKLGKAQFRVHWQVMPFNFSKMVNLGAKTAKGAYLLLLNNDTQVISPSNWLEEMVGYVRREEIGGVGCKLLYPDNTLQHAGIICGLGGVANHSHKHYPVESPGYIGRLNIVANYAGSTAACLMVRRAVWEALNGFDESLQVAFNDVDFCLRILDAGYRHVVLPHVWLYHFESKSRGVEDNPLKQQRFAGEVDTMEQRWKQSYIAHDPYYNPHLTKKRMDFSIDEESPYYCETDYEELL